MALEVIIVDDEPASRRALKECCAREADLRVIGEYGDSRSALEAIRAHPPDLLFLDIQIDSLTGLEIARSLDAAALPLIVFVTAYDHHALEAFEVSAIDYLLKPFDDARFQSTLARVRNRHQERNHGQRQLALNTLLQQLESSAGRRYDAPPRVIAEANGRMHVIDVTQIEVVEADRNYVKITVGRAQYSTRSTLQQAEQWLQSQPILKVSRSCLVNMGHVREISQTPRGDAILVLAGGVTVTSSEGYREAVRQYLDRMRMGARDRPD
jgi:two-component system LytT family response regulator